MMRCFDSQRSLSIWRARKIVPHDIACLHTCTLFELTKNSVSAESLIFCILSYMSFIQRPFRFFSKNYPLLFMLLCYPNFCTFLFHLVSYVILLVVACITVFEPVSITAFWMCLSLIKTESRVLSEQKLIKQLKLPILLSSCFQTLSHLFKNMLKRREECDTYLTHVPKHLHCI